ncbi:sulfotransferase family protein [Cognatilysobacter segetis]|uniref:sulfotransferase family protein n=2 Tax=Cognatilysobacter segetis TaxID=2492394 RepID=UPI0010612B55|nr:sulfotransferase [Lysobacter segetis]
MKLPRPWVPLDAPVDAGRIRAELAADASPWRAADGVGGAMIRCRSLLAPGDPGIAAAPALAAWLARLGGPWSRVSVECYAPGAHTPARVDASRDGRQHARVVLPLHGDLLVECEGERILARAGRPGLLDTWRRHRIANVGVETGWIVLADIAGVPEPGPATGTTSGHLRVEHGVPAPMDPWELDTALGQVLSDAPEAARDARIRTSLASLVRIARAAWAEGAPAAALAQAVAQARAALVDAGAERLRLRNGLGVLDALDRQAFAPLVDRAPRGEPAPDAVDPQFDRPVFIVSPPRAGSTLLFETLTRARGAVSIGDESHALIEGIASLAPAAHGFDSNRLSAADATPAVALALRNRFLDQLHDRDGHRIDAVRRVRMLEKTPKNALRLPFLRAVFPEARFLYLHRDPRQVIASMIESWRSGRFVTYPQLPGWQGPPWSLLLVPGWQALAGQPLDAIVGAQWDATMRTLLDDLDAVPAERRLGVDYADLLADPVAQLQRICAWADLDWDRPLDASLPLSRYTVSAPGADKWRRHEAEVERQLAARGDLADRAAAACR